MVTLKERVVTILAQFISYWTFTFLNNLYRVCFQVSSIWNAVCGHTSAAFARHLTFEMLLQPILHGQKHKCTVLPMVLNRYVQRKEFACYYIIVTHPLKCKIKFKTEEKTKSAKGMIVYSFCNVCYTILIFCTIIISHAMLTHLTLYIIPSLNCVYILTAPAQCVYIVHVTVLCF